MKKFTSHLLEPRAIILGFTTFYFSSTALMWIHSPYWQYHTQMFVATVMLIAALSLAINRAWSNFLAGVISAQLPLALVADFWMLSGNAEVTLFSYEHFKIWWQGISYVDLTPFLWLTVSTVILSCLIVSYLSSPQRR